jgi:hypothetical protein
MIWITFNEQAFLSLNFAVPSPFPVHHFLRRHSLTRISTSCFQDRHQYCWLVKVLEFWFQIFLLRLQRKPEVKTGSTNFFWWVCHTNVTKRCFFSSGLSHESNACQLTKHLSTVKDSWVSLVYRMCTVWVLCDSAIELSPLSSESSYD